MKIILVAGARPNFMKIAPIIRTIRSFNKINHTNQTNYRNQIDEIRPEKRANEIVEAIRFINLPKKRRLESVKRHREWQKLLNKDRFFDEVFGK